MRIISERQHRNYLRLAKDLKTAYAKLALHGDDWQVKSNANKARVLDMILAKHSRVKVEAGPLHLGNNLNGVHLFCEECSRSWPCPTFREIHNGYGYRQCTDKPVVLDLAVKPAHPQRDFPLAA